MDRVRGLPTTKKMRHDAHYVDRLAARPTDKVGQQIPVERIEPNPKQPRRTMTGIDELVASIQEKGVLEPILVREMRGDRYQIIAGERRFRAAQEAGLTNVPCIVLDVDDRGCLEISLVENLQRRDLTPFEEADALAELKEDFGYTHEEIARKLGRSRTAVTDSICLATMPPAIRLRCEKAGISTRSTLLQIARLPDEGQMDRMLDAVAAEGLSRDELREMLRDDAGEPTSPSDDAPRKGRSGGYLFRYRDPEKRYTFNLRFASRENVKKAELIRVLEGILAELRASR